MQTSRVRFGIRDAVLVVALTLGAGGLAPAIGIVSAHDPTMQETHPTSQQAGTAADPGCGEAAGPVTEPKSARPPYHQMGYLPE